MKHKYLIIIALVIIICCLTATPKHNEGFTNFSASDIDWKQIKMVKSLDKKLKSIRSDCIVKYYNLKNKTIYNIETTLKNIGFLV